MEEYEYSNYCKICCGYFRDEECHMDEEWLTQPPLCETLDDDMLEEMAQEAIRQEDYTIPIGIVRREWTNPDPEMLGWLDVHKVGVVTVLYDSEGYKVYKYNLDDGRRVWETFSISENKTVLVAIEEEVENV